MKNCWMPDVKSAVKRLRDLSAGVMHQDIGKSDLFRETADMLEWYDRELYAQKEENRRLLRLLKASGTRWGDEEGK